MHDSPTGRCECWEDVPTRDGEDILQTQCIDIRMLTFEEDLSLGHKRVRYLCINHGGADQDNGPIADELFLYALKRGDPTTDTDFLKDLGIKPN